MSNSTPGPWVAVRQDFRRLDAPEPFYTVGPSEFTTIADVRAGSDDDDLPAQVEANARLIAAAPDLLAALRDAALQIEYLHEKFQKTGSGNTVLFMINNAIARATGGAA